MENLWKIRGLMYEALLVYQGLMYGAFQGTSVI